MERHLTLEQLAEETGISKSALGKYESDDFKDISPFSIVTLAKFYGVSTDYLLGRETSLCADLSGLSDEAAGHVLLLIDDLRRAADLRNT